MSDLYDRLGSAASDEVRADLLERAFPDDLPESRKAAWAYGHVLRRSGEEIDAERLAEFRAGYVAALRDHARLAAERDPPAIDPGRVPPLGRTLIAGWHFPEHVRLTSLALREGVLVLAAAPAPWLARLDEAGLVLNFRETRAPVKLARWMAAGRPVYAMVDHCYPETMAVEVPFLTYPARTPAGVFHLAARYGYSVTVVGPREEGDGSGVAVVAEHPPDGAEAMCRAVTATVEAEIMGAPPRWTMWPSVDSRWVGVTYD